MENIQKFLKYIVYGAIFLAPFLVFIVDSSELFPFITGKNFAFRVLIELAFGSWLILAFLKEDFRPKKSILLASVTIFIGVVFLADIFGVEPKQSLWSNFERMDGWVTLIHLFAYTVILSSTLNTRKLWDLFWNTSIVASVGLGLFSIAQLLRMYLVKTLEYPTDHALVKLLPIVNQGGDRIDATLGNASYLAVYMLLHIFITTVMLLRYKSLSLKMKILYVSALILQMVSLYYTATRGAILGLVGSVLLISILFVFFEPKKTKLRKVSMGVLAAVVVLVAGFFALKNTDFVKGQHTLNRLAVISLEDKTTNARFMMWDLAWKGVKENPILGYGQGNFNYVFNKHYNPGLFDQEAWFDRSHNIVFDWLIAAGFIGFISYVFIFIALIRMLIKSVNLSKREKIIYIGMFSAYVFQNLFIFDQITSYIIFFALIAFIHSLESKKELLPKVFKIDHGVRNRMVISIVVVLTLAMPFWVNANGYNQSRTVIKALNTPQAKTIEELNNNVSNVKDLLQKAVVYNSFGTAEIRERLPSIAVEIAKAEQVDESLRQDFVLFTKEELEKQVNLTPNDARYQLIFANFLMQFGVFDEAIKHFEKAIELSPTKQGLYAQLAQVYGLTKDYDKMFELTKRGYEIYKENDQAWESYVLATKISGKNQLYNDLLNQVLEEGRYNRVILFVRKQMETNPDFPDLKFILAIAYADSGRTTEAINIINDLRSKYQDSFEKKGAEFVRKIQAGEPIKIE